VNVTKAIGHLQIRQSRDAANRIALESPVPNARKEALQILWRLSDFGSPDETTAQCARNDDNETVRIFACELISSIQARWATRLLLDSLLTDSRYVANRVLLLLANRAQYKWVADTILEAAADPDRKPACRRAIWAVGEYALDTPMAIDIVARAATDYDDPSLRRAAIDTLPKIGNDQTVHVLRKALQDTHRNVRLAAIEAICKFLASQRLDYLANLLLDDLISLLDDIEKDVATSASDLLIKLDGDEVVEKLRSKVRNHEIDRRDLAVRTIAGLVKRGDSRVARNASNALEALSNDREDTVRYHAAIGLRRYRPNLSAQVFRGLIHSSDPQIIERVKETLEEWGELP
jgi:HEAT repeat protein